MAAKRAAIKTWTPDLEGFKKVGKVLKKMGSEGTGNIKAFMAEDVDVTCPCFES
jgi:hypothetical protein